MCETIDGHDGFVMGMAEARGFDDKVWLGWDADMMCSAGQRWPLRLEPWLLFDNAALALDFRSLACAAGGDLARLHQLADVSGGN